MNTPESINDAVPAQSNLPTLEETQDYIQELRGQRNGLLDQVTGLAATVKGLERKFNAVTAEFAAYKAEVEKAKAEAGAGNESKKKDE